MSKTEQRASTPAKILRAAKHVFLEKGFEGASINDIADRAKINKSLIYHHFENKENLWRTIKAQMIQQHAGKSLDDITFSTDSFRSFVKEFISFRFNFYADNPSIARLITWQMLEKNKESIEGVQADHLLDISSQIVAFQQSGQVKPNLDPQMVAFFMMSSASAPFMDPPPFLTGKNLAQNRDTYLQMLVDSICTAFATQQPQQKWLIK